MNNKIKANTAYTTVIHILLILFSVACLVPLLTVISVSMSSEEDIFNLGYRLFPKAFDFLAYKYIFNSPSVIMRAYGVTIFVTVVGTVLALVVNSLAAYALSRKQFDYRKKLSFIIFFTTMFSGGLIPTYILITRDLNLSNNIWVMILPSLAAPWNMFILRTNFMAVPEAIIESAKIDGVNEFYIYSRIMLPLCKPALATIGLFMTLGFWNDWWLCLLYIDKANLANLQYLLYKMMASVSFMTSQNSMKIGINLDTSKLPNESMRMAMVVLAAGPMLFGFSFFQKYFVQGLTVGSIKG